MRCGKEKEIVGKRSHNIAKILYIFFSPDGFNMSHGLRLEQTLLRFVMGPMVQDMKAHKAVNDTKGSGGLKCCNKCKNMLNKAPEEIAGPYFKHYALADASEWDRHTPETYREEAAILSMCQGHITKGNFENLEKTFGLNYNPTGAVFDEHCQKIFSPVTHQYEDSMHTFYASGGIAQSAGPSIEGPPGCEA